MSLVDFPGVAVRDFSIRCVEVNSLFFRYAEPGDVAHSPIAGGFTADLRRAADDAGVEVFSIAVDRHGDLSATDESERRDAVECHRKWFEVCNLLGCSVLRANSGGMNCDITPKHIDQCTASFATLAELGQAHGVKVVMENHWGLSEDADRMVQIIRWVNSPWMGALPDFGNFPAGVDRYEALAKLAPYAMNVHAKFQSFDQQGQDPNLDTARVMSIFKQANYAGPFIIEYEGQEDDHQGIAKSKALLERYT